MADMDPTFSAAALDANRIGQLGPPADPQALADAIVGTWKSPFGTATFNADGTVSGRLTTGMSGEGRWSVGADGRLHGEGMGTSVDVDATVQGNDLTLSLDGRAVRLKRGTGT